MPLPPYQPRQPVPAPETGTPRLPPLLHELSPEQWNLWKRHPVTALVLERYLPDFRASLERQILEAWLVNNVSLAQQESVKGHLLGAHQRETLTLDHLRSFYDMPPPGTPGPKRP